MKQNVLVKIILISLAAFLVLVLVIKFAGGSGGEDIREVDGTEGISGGEQMDKATLEGLGLEADSATDVVATLIGETKGLKKDINRLSQENKDLRQDNKTLRDMEKTIATRIESKVDKELMRMKHKLSKEINHLQVPNNGKKEVTTQGGQTVWIKPLNASAEGGRENPLDKIFDRKRAAANRLGLATLPGSKSTKNGKRQNDFKPVYTIAKNSTLVGSTAFTALVGRVPVAGNVTDPYSFKVIIGEDNLIANGIELPEVAYSVASGKAHGDWTLGCVRGVIQSLTFVFKDGTIRTVPKPQDAYEGGNETRDTTIGELADNFGNPCVVGKRITNAYSYLSQRIGIAATGAAAEAAAAAETTTLTSVGSGGLGTASSVDGSTGNYIFGRTMSESANEVADWLDERQSQHFDAIYVPPGNKVAIHITEEISIDYDTMGRKTHHKGFTLGGLNRELD